MRIRALAVSLCVYAVSCTSIPPPIAQPSTVDDQTRQIMRQECAALWQDELGRAIDAEAEADCLGRRLKAGATIEDFRAQIRQSQEYADRQAALAAVTLPRLVAWGQVLALETGSAFTAIEASDFTLYQQFLDGGAEAIEPQLQQLEDLGFNVVRIFGMYNNPVTAGGLGRFLPDEYGGRYWTERAAFYQRLARHGLYGEWVVFADTRPIYPTIDRQREFAARTTTAFDEITNALVEWVNEADQSINQTDLLPELGRIPSVLTSHGSNGSQARPVEPFLDYATFHTNGAPEEQRKVGHNAWEIWSGPTLANETSRSPDARVWQGLTAEAFAFDAAAGASLLAAGSCFHSTDGKYGRLLTEPSVAHARAWIAGARSVPLACQGGRYRHDEFIPQEQAEGMLRIYARGDDPACLVRIRP